MLNVFIFASEWCHYLHICRLSFARSSRLRKQHCSARCPSLGASFRRPRRRPERTETRPTDCRRRWLTRREPSRSAVVCIERKIGERINVIHTQHSKDQNKTISQQHTEDLTLLNVHDTDLLVGMRAELYEAVAEGKDSKSLRVKTFSVIRTQRSKEENKTVNNTLRIWLFWMCTTLICGRAGLYEAKKKVNAWG